MVVLEEGARVWYGGHQDGSWRAGVVVASVGGSGGDVVVKASEHDYGSAGEESTVPSEHVYVMNRGVEEDMTALHHIHEPGILENLRLRAIDDAPYTFMGPVLVSVNPLRELDESSYGCGTSRAKGPFAIAETALQQLQLGARSGAGDQSIVIGGESGSGKTESAKRVIRHIVARCHAGAEGNALEERLLQVSPILEAIGNASTCMNHNSSRFGKYTKVLLEKKADNSGWAISGARIETYLLEKSRVVFHGAEERSFHILHYLSSASSQLPDFHLDECKLDESESRKGDEKRFLALREALDTVGISQDVLFRALAGVLHLLQVKFVGDADEATIEDGSAQVCCDLLGLDGQESLRKLLCEREVRFPGSKDPIITSEGLDRAMYNRNAVAKAIYAGIFEWVLHHVNESLCQKTKGSVETSPTEMHFVGVLDIFGFESMQQNSFEQLLINYTNEALQDTFIRQVFEAEVALYKAEGLVMKDADFPPPRASSECVHLFHGVTGKPGLLALIDEVSRAPQPTDEKLNQSMHNKFSGHACFPKPHPKDIRTTFIVAHYPGPVSYVAEGFIHKNNDQLPDRAEAFLSASSNASVSWGRSDAGDGNNTKAGRGGQRRPQRRKQQSIVSKFSVQIKELVQTLEATKCSFIRCVKPNVQMKREANQPWFDRSLVVSQLRCLSIEQTAQVLKSGLPTRIPYQSLIDAYSEALPTEALRIWQNLGGGNEREFTKALFWAFDVPHKAYRCGNTRVFFRNGQLSMLDRILEASKVWSCASPTDAKAQAERKWVIDRFKLYYVRMLWRNCVIKALAAKHFEDRLMYFRTRNTSAVTLQRCMRGYHARRAYQVKQKAALQLQCFIRCNHARQELAMRLEIARQEAEELAKKLEEESKAAEALKQLEIAEQMRTLTERSRSWRKSPPCSRNSSFIGSVKPGGHDLRSELLAVQVRHISDEDFDIDSTPSTPVQQRGKKLQGGPNLMVQAPSEPVEVMSIEKCKRIASEIFGDSPGDLTIANIEAFKEQTYGQHASNVLVSRLTARIQEDETQRTLFKEQKNRMRIQLEEVEQRCWEYKVVAAEREARITELTTRMLDMEADFRKREQVFAQQKSERLPVMPGSLTCDEAESLASLVSIIQSQQLQLVAQSDEIKRLTRLQQDTQDAKEYMANVLDQLTLDLERERTQAKRNFNFFEEKLRETDSELKARDELIRELQRHIPLPKPMKPADEPGSAPAADPTSTVAYVA